MNTPTIQESQINIIAEGTRLEGKLHFENISRVHGILIGEVTAVEGSTLILGETGLVEGNIQADQLVIDGFVRGEIRARRKVVISRTGRVIGNIETPALELETGAFFEGRCRMEKLPPPAAVSGSGQQAEAAAPAMS